MKREREKILKQEKAITLIALMITIIILIILAAVTINSAFNLNILDVARKAKEEYTEGQNKEKDELDKLSENMDDIIEEIEGTNKIWKKEHQVRVKAKGDINKIKNIKYQWTDTTEEPEPNTFTNTIENGGMVVENTLTGKYYLWTLIEEISGNLKIKRSEFFCFDNTAPTGEIKTEMLEEGGKEKVKVIITNVKDEHSGLNDNSVKLFITPENGTREEKKITLIDGEGSIILDNEGVIKVELIVIDNAGNKLEIQKNCGRIYILRNGVPVRGDVEHWASRNVYGSCYPGTGVYIFNANGGNTMWSEIAALKTNYNGQINGIAHVNRYMGRGVCDCWSLFKCNTSYYIF